MPTTGPSRPTAVQPKKPDAQRQKPVIRAFPEDMEILTEHGFYRFDDLYSGDLLAGEQPWAGKGLDQSFRVRELPWTLYIPSPAFPRVASVNPRTGEVDYYAPSLFRVFTYDDWLLRVKLLGVDVLMTRYTDALLKGKYGRGYDWVLADNILKKNAPATFYYYLLNKFDQDLYGPYEPQTGLHAQLDAPATLKPTTHIRWEKIQDLYDYDQVDPSTGRKVKADRVRTEVEVFNVDVAPFHNVIVRWGRKNSHNPQRPWIGRPVVLGDGSDKSELRVNRIQALRGEA